MSYKVKNCPALQQTYYCHTHHSKCQDCTDCVMKQIYEMCKSQKESSCIFTVALLADRILRLFDIEEVRE